MADTIKFILVALIVVGAIGGFYYYSDESLLLRVIALILSGGIALAILSQTASGREAWVFIGEARTEVRKVVWPSRKETIQTTLVVMGMVLVVALFLWLLDMFLTWVVKILTGQGG